MIIACWVGLVMTAAACRDTVSPASSFYYWKTVFRLTPSERESLTQHQVNRLYIRYFDVVSGEDGPLPDATIVFKDSIPENMEVVPVVFMVNHVLTRWFADSTEVLAERIYARIASMNHAYHITSVPEIQMDVDWNATTRDKYFKLLLSLQRLCHSDDKVLSATLRLHQWKYSKSTGIPPVDKVTLMCYNMGHLTEYGNRNSILNVDDAQDYMLGLGLYPLPVDVAFPLFSWGVCFSNQQYRGIINGLCHTDMQQPYFSEILPNLYHVDSTIVLHGAYLRKGDHIRLEEPSVEEIRQVTRILASQTKTPKYVIWYHLDSLLLQKHPYHELQKTVDLFR